MNSSIPHKHAVAKIPYYPYKFTQIRPKSMNAKTIIPTLAAIALGFTAHATLYNGNGNTSFGGPIGNGSLTLTDNGTTVFGSLVVAGGGLGGNAFVLYLQTPTGASGFSSTVGFNDNADQLRTALSQYNGGGSQSILNFGGGGFTPNYGIALQPGAGINFGGLWSLANGGANSQNFVSSIGLSPTGSDGAGTYTFSFSLASVGLTAGQSFNLFGLEVSTTGFSSAEAIGGTLSGANGYGQTQTVTAFSTYTTTPVPEPATLALVGFSGLATLVAIRRRK